MVIFDQLRISDNGNKLYIDVHIPDVKGYEDMYLDSITIRTRRQIMESDPSILEDDKNYVWQQVFPEDDNRKSYSIVLAEHDMPNYIIPTETKKDPCGTKFAGNLSLDLFYVYVKIRGNIGNVDCLPCRWDECTSIGVTFDENMLHQRVMNYVKQLADDCTVPQGFADFILLWNAFKSSVETEHYLTANKFYDMLFDNRVNTGYTQFTGGGGCGCHG